MKERKNVTWRVAEHSESKKINQWLDKQKNIQESIANIVLHMIDKYGYVNITDYQVQKQLYGKITEIEPSAVAEEGEETKEQPKQQEVEEEIEKDTVNKKNNIFDGVDPDNL